MAEFFLGLEVGASAPRATIFSSRGDEVAVAARRTALSRAQHGWSEMNPEAAGRAVCDTFREVVARSGAPAGGIAAIGVAGAPDRSAVLWGSRARARARARAIEAAEFPEFPICALPLPWLAKPSRNVSRGAAVLTGGRLRRLTCHS